MITVASLTACVPPPPAAPGPRTEVVQVEVGPPRDLLQAREALAGPAVELAEAILDVAGRVDHVRHEVPRGRPQARAAAEVMELADAAEAAAAALREAADGLDADHEGQRVAAETLAELGEEVAGTVRADLASLGPHVEHDIAVDSVVEGWSSRGSRAEIVDRFDILVAEAEGLVTAAEELADSPPGCPTLRDNRVVWAAAVRAKTTELRVQAAAFDGPRFDELVARYALAPRGEDQVAADAEGRPCWADSTELLAVPDTVREVVEALEDALNS